jgi:hypothetical protein
MNDNTRATRQASFNASKHGTIYDLPDGAVADFNFACPKTGISDLT